MEEVKKTTSFLPYKRGARAWFLAILGDLFTCYMFTLFSLSSVQGTNTYMT